MKAGAEKPTVNAATPPRTNSRRVIGMINVRKFFTRGPGDQEKLVQPESLLNSWPSC
jgi:hypothetical protein